eukprot:UC4_evm1s398
MEAVMAEKDYFENVEDIVTLLQKRGWEVLERVRCNDFLPKSNPKANTGEIGNILSTCEGLIQKSKDCLQVYTGPLLSAPKRINSLIKAHYDHLKAVTTELEEVTKDIVKQIQSFKHVIHDLSALFKCHGATNVN